MDNEGGFRSPERQVKRDQTEPPFPEMHSTLPSGESNQRGQKEKSSPGVTAMPTSRNSTPYRQRKGLIQTHKSPVSRLATGSLIQTWGLKLRPPHPAPQYRLDAAGDPSPDRGAVQEWPWVNQGDE